ncbi:MAG TPA: hypothetical protein DD827_02285 [Gammaproteobacteria bacterium]|nr:hypothetical protein [Gammaproteobacteria bacterium]
MSRTLTDHLSGKDQDGIVTTGQLSELIGDWKSYLLNAQSDEVEDFQKHAAQAARWEMKVFWKWQRNYRNES